MGISLKGFGKSNTTSSGASISGLSALPPEAANVRLSQPAPTVLAAWADQQGFIPDDSAIISRDEFGSYIKISYDGQYILSGSAGTDLKGSVYLLKWNSISKSWVQDHKFEESPTYAAANNMFGKGLAISADNNMIVITANGTSQFNYGNLYAFAKVGNTWVETLFATGAGNRYLGYDLDMTPDGQTLIAGSNGSEARVYTRSGNSWVESALLTAADTVWGDSFGQRVAINDAGDVALVSAPSKGGVAAGTLYVFTKSGSTWTEAQTLVTPNTGNTDYERFGSAISISGDGSTIAVGVPGDDQAGAALAAANSGMVYIYTKNVSTWTLESSFVGSNVTRSANFGSSIALSYDGNALVAGAPYHNQTSGMGAAYVYNRDGIVWSETTMLSAADPKPNQVFGQSVDILPSGDKVVIGSPQWSTVNNYPDGYKGKIYIQS